MNWHRIVRNPGFAICAAVLSSAPAAAADWPQFGFDPQHSGNNVLETGYPTATGNQRLYTVAVGISDAQPIYASGIATPAGVKNLLYIARLDGSLLAVDAEDGAVIWSQSTSGVAPNVRSSAALDPNRLFVYAAGVDGKIHKYASGDGTETIDASWPEISSLKPQFDAVSSALSIATDSSGASHLYAATNGYFDLRDYQGHVTAIDLQTGTQIVFNTQCSDLMQHFVVDGTPRVDDCDLKGPNQDMSDGQMSGIWGRPGVVYDAGTDRIYFASGNGLFDANTAGGFEWGDSVLALHPDGSGAGMGWPLDSYTPDSYADLYSGDLDLGSNSPAILPSPSAQYPHLAVQVGKDGSAQLLNLDDLSGQGGPGHVGSPFAIAPLNVGSFMFAQPAVWVDAAGNTWVFMPQSSDLQAYQLLFYDSGVPLLHRQWTGSGATSSPVVANGVLYFEGGGGSSPELRAYDAGSGAWLWGSLYNAGAHFQAPIVVDSHVYFVDSQGTLYSYLLDGVFRSGFQ